MDRNQIILMIASAFVGAFAKSIVDLLFAKISKLNIRGWLLENINKFTISLIQDAFWLVISSIYIILQIFTSGPVTALKAFFISFWTCSLLFWFVAFAKDSHDYHEYLQERESNKNQK